MIFKDDEDAGIFTSSRPGGKGKDDLYSFRLPEMEFCYQGDVFDSYTGNLLGATVTINGSNGDSFTVTADADGTFALCDKEIKNNTTYDVEVKYEGYINRRSFLNGRVEQQHHHDSRIPDEGGGIGRGVRHAIGVLSFQ